MRAALPIVLGYLPVGMAFGILARQVGLTPSEAGLMSLLVYAGASRSIAVEMISEGMVRFPAVLATFFINLQPHALISGIPVFIFAWKVKSLWGSVIPGMAIYWGLGFIFFPPNFSSL